MALPGSTFTFIRLELTLDFDNGICLYDITDFDIIESIDIQTAVES